MKHISIRTVVWAALGTLFLLLVLSIPYYMNVQRPLWNDQNRAEQRAMKETDLALVKETLKYNGEASYMVVKGEDTKKRSMIVWVGKDDVHAAYAAEGIDAKYAEHKVKERHPDADIVRTVPGVKDEEYIWEVFYKRDERGGTRHYYDFYRFSDGELMDTYTLSLTP